MTTENTNESTTNTNDKVTVPPIDSKKELKISLNEYSKFLDLTETTTEGIKIVDETTNGIKSRLDEYKEHLDFVY
jgi:hypothetical protein